MVNDKKKNFAVVGVGPIGGIMGAHLAQAGHNVFLVDILHSHLDAIKHQGLEIEGMREMKVSFPSENMCYSIDQLADKKIDALFVSVKASVMQSILPILKKVLSSSTILISLQNGLDTENPIAEVFGRSRTLRMVVNYAGNLVADGKIVLSFFNAPNYMGCMDVEAEGISRDLAESITLAGLDTSFTQDIRKYEWEKAILNAALSPVCALTRRTMKQMMGLAATRELVGAILFEGIDVARADGVEFPPDFFSKCMSYLDNAGHHKTSMHVDVERGSPTEIGFLNGKIVDHGAIRGIPTPCNSTIVSLIRGSELEKYKKPGDRVKR